MTTPDTLSSLSPEAWSTPCRRPPWRQWPITAPSGATPSGRSTQDAHQVFHDLAAVGVDYDNVVDLLENEGLTKFEKSWATVTDELSDRLRTSTPHPKADDAPLPHERAHS